jgi:hypothetical protein
VSTMVLTLKTWLDVREDDWALLTPLSESISYKDTFFIHLAVIQYTSVKHDNNDNNNDESDDTDVRSR